jgi:hypothetical protein
MLLRGLSMQICSKIKLEGLLKQRAISVPITEVIKDIVLRDFYILLSIVGCARIRMSL